MSKRTQKRAGIALTAALAVMAGLNVATSGVDGHVINAVILGVAAVGAALTIRASAWGRVVQVSLVAALGVFTVFMSEPLDVVGPALMILAVLLARAHGLYDTALGWDKRSVLEELSWAAVLLITGAGALVGGFASPVALAALVVAYGVMLWVVLDE